MNEIAVVFDFSPSSKQVLNFAVDLAIKQKSFVTIIWIDNKEYRSIVNIPSSNNYIDQLKAKVDSIIDDYVPQLPYINFEFRIAKGDNFSSVIKIVSELQINLLLMGRIINKGFRSLIKGDYQMHIQSEVGCPLLLFPVNYTFNKEIDSIYIAIDESIDTRQKLPITLILAKSYKSKLVLRAISDKDNSKVLDKYKEQSINYLSKYGVEIMDDEKEYIDTSLMKNLILETSKVVNKNKVALLISMRKCYSDSLLKKRTLTQEYIEQLEILVLTIPNKG